MTREQFNNLTYLICNVGMSVPLISTGLYPVSLDDDSLRMTRTIEILHKVIENEILTSSEANALKAIIDLGDLEALKNNLTQFWVANHPALRA